MILPRLLQPSKTEQEKAEKAHAHTIETYNELISQAEGLVSDMKSLAKKALNGVADGKELRDKSRSS